MLESFPLNKNPENSTHVFLKLAKANGYSASAKTEFRGDGTVPLESADLKGVAPDKNVIIDDAKHNEGKCEGYCDL